MISKALTCGMCKKLTVQNPGEKLSFWRLSMDPRLIDQEGDEERAENVVCHNIEICHSCYGYIRDFGVVKKRRGVGEPNE